MNHIVESQCETYKKDFTKTSDAKIIWEASDTEKPRPNPPRPEESTNSIPGQQCFQSLSSVPRDLHPTDSTRGSVAWITLDLETPFLSLRLKRGDHRPLRFGQSSLMVLA